MPKLNECCKRDIRNRSFISASDPVTIIKQGGATTNFFFRSAPFVFRFLYLCLHIEGHQDQSSDNERNNEVKYRITHNMCPVDSFKSRQRGCVFTRTNVVLRIEMPGLQHSGQKDQSFVGKLREVKARAGPSIISSRTRHLPVASGVIFLPDLCG